MGFGALMPPFSSMCLEQLHMHSCCWNNCPCLPGADNQGGGGPESWAPNVKVKGRQHMLAARYLGTAAKLRPETTVLG